MRIFLTDFLNKAVDWLFRVRTLGAQLLKAGVGLLVIVMAADYAGKFAFSYGELKVNVEGSAGSDLPAYLVYLAAAIAFAMVVAGIILIWRDERRERRKLLIVVEARGLHNGPDSPAKDVIKSAFRGQRTSILVDFRPQQSGELVNPVLMLDRIRGMMLQLTSAIAGRDSSDVSVAAGGLAAVPGMFLIGMRLEDEARVERYDWNRDISGWKMIDGIDDGNRPTPVSIPAIPPGQDEVVLAVSASYAVDQAAIGLTFPGIPIARLAAAKMQTNAFWSDASQQEFAKEFRHVVQKLGEHHIKRIHLVLAAPASLTLRLGASYDERNHPELVVYQYEKSSAPPYPWGILIPNHGTIEPTIITKTAMPA
jgi:hypothetical protein